MAPDVLNYFLIVLGGFGCVWGFRRASGRQTGSISDFEYAAFSTIWGIPLFLAFAWIMKEKAEVLSHLGTTPMIATPALFILGASAGVLGARLWAFVEEGFERAVIKWPGLSVFKIGS